MFAGQAQKVLPSGHNTVLLKDMLRAGHICRCTRHLSSHMPHGGKTGNLQRKLIGSSHRGGKLIGSCQQRDNLIGSLTVRSRSTAAAAAEDEDTFQSEYEQARPFNDIPGPKGLPYLGTLYQYTSGPYKVERFHEALLHHYKKYGPIWKETIAGSTIVHLMDPDFVKVAYQHEGRIPHIPPLLETTQMYRKYRDLSPGLGNTNGEEWYRLRSAVQQMMMRPKAVSMYLPYVNEVANDLMNEIPRRLDSRNEVPDFKNILARWNLESSGMTCFETRLQCFGASEDSHQQKLINSIMNIFRYSLQLRFSIPWFKVLQTPTWKKLVETEDYFFGHGQKLVDSTISHIKELSEAGELKEGAFMFLSYLMSKPELSHKDISIITLSLFGDGLSTTTPSLIGQLYCLATNPAAQEKLHEEITSVVGKNKQITSAMLGRMSYLKACVKEGFRFFPIGTEVSRIPQKNIVIGGYQIPAGTHLELNNNMLLRLEEYFTSPEDYRPERWSREGEGESAHPYLLIPFGHGPRMCAGRRFAEQEMYVVITKLLQKYRLEWQHKPMAQRYTMLLWPDQPAQFTFIPRN